MKSDPLSAPGVGTNLGFVKGRQTQSLHSATGVDTNLGCVKGRRSQSGNSATVSEWQTLYKDFRYGLGF